MKTLVITKRHVARVLTPQVANRAVEKAFKAYGLGEVRCRQKAISTSKGEIYALCQPTLMAKGFMWLASRVSTCILKTDYKTFPQ